MHRSAGQTNRVNREAVFGRFVCSALRFIPHEPRKKTLIPYIYNVSNKDPSKHSPINGINSTFPQQRVLNIILCINHCACDLPNCRNYLMTLTCKCFNTCQNDKCKYECISENVLNVNVDRKWWQEYYNIPFTVTTDTKLEWLQFRIFHRIIATNQYLFHIKSVESDVCTFCHYAKETIIHLFGTAYISTSSG